MNTRQSYPLALLLLIGASLSALEIKPGYQEGIPSKGEASRTIRLYIPQLYAEHNDLPILFCSSPSGNPNIKEFSPWAESFGVILVGIDSSRNGPSDNNIQAQEAAIATLFDASKPAAEQLQGGLWFATGHSGGAQASWLLADRHGARFGGLLMRGQAGHDSALERHIAVAYIRGDKERNNSWIEKDLASLRSKKNPVKDLVIPGGHVDGSLSQRIEFLEWMMNHAAIAHPHLTPQQRLANLERRLAPIRTLHEQAKHLETIAAVESLASIAAVQASPAAKELSELWSSSQLAQLATYTEPRRRFVEISEALEHPLMGGEVQREFRNQLRALGREAGVADERRALRPWLNVRKMILAGQSPEAEDLKKFYQQVIAQFPDTEVAKKAQAALDRP